MGCGWGIGGVGEWMCAVAGSTGWWVVCVGVYNKGFEVVRWWGGSWRWGTVTETEVEAALTALSGGEHRMASGVHAHLDSESGCSSVATGAAGGFGPDLNSGGSEETKDPTCTPSASARACASAAEAAAAAPVSALLGNCRRAGSISRQRATYVCSTRAIVWLRGVGEWMCAVAGSTEAPTVSRESISWKSVTDLI